MNKIEKLINELCPSGTKRMKIKDICSSISSGGTPKRDEESYYNGNIPWLRTQEVDFNEIFDTGLKITEEGLKNSSAKYIKENCVIIAMYGATAGKVAINKIPLTTNQACCNLEINPEIANYKYVYHWLFKNYQNLKALGQGSQSNINSKIVKDFIIPIPPLEIQEEIVKILDKFTDYVTELTTELTLRQKQYNYYRDNLLSFEEGEVEWRLLGEVARLKNGKDWKNLQSGNVPVFGSGGHMGKYVDTCSYNKPTVLIPRKGSISNLFYIDMPFWNVDTIYYTEINYEFVIPKYFYYVLKNVDLESMATNPTRPSLTQSIIDKIPIPIPSIEEQKKIVEVLDYLFIIISDIENGLPKEIELRQKQYEYYRDKLLTFD